ncbi:hypothetical protein HCN44_001802 [Aphidius gifuensis]|uniref:Uncharacterized protein n=1 Tax=Aphidius gifuensis TaxID=684658 RepID=A0A835CR46_APHGI|nr:hypothetical protein HCN44_001802 [Aphidius gifuensis]
MEVNNLAQILNKFSLDEQSKYEDLVQKNTNTFKGKMPLFSSCLKNYNSLKKSLRCIDQHQISKNQTDNVFYKNFKNLLDMYNTILIPKIKDIENKFITTTDEIISIAKNNNEELINKKLSINVPSTAPLKKILKEVMPLFDNCLENNNGLKNKLRCIDQNQNPKNETQKECYENVIDLLNSYNSVLISKIKNIEKNFMATTNEVISIAKNNNDELIRRKSRISLPPTAPKKKVRQK